MKKLTLLLLIVLTAAMVDCTRADKKCKADHKKAKKNNIGWKN